MIASSETGKIYLHVPFTECEEAKNAGAFWDPEAKAWYIGPHADPEKMSRWENPPPPLSTEENDMPEDPTKLTEEFSDALKSAGCIVSFPHPVIDGKSHRIATDGDKPGELSGFYVAYPDGHPSGYIKNNPFQWS